MNCWLGYNLIIINVWRRRKVANFVQHSHQDYIKFKSLKKGTATVIKQHTDLASSIKQIVVDANENRRKQENLDYLVELQERITSNIGHLVICFPYLLLLCFRFALLFCWTQSNLIRICCTICGLSSRKETFSFGDLNRNSWRLTISYLMILWYRQQHLPPPPPLLLFLIVQCISLSRKRNRQVPARNSLPDINWNSCSNSVTCKLNRVLQHPKVPTILSFLPPASFSPSSLFFSLSLSPLFPSPLPSLLCLSSVSTNSTLPPNNHNREQTEGRWWGSGDNDTALPVSGVSKRTISHQSGNGHRKEADRPCTETTQHLATPNE